MPGRVDDAPDVPLWTISTSNEPSFVIETRHGLIRAPKADLPSQCKFFKRELMRHPARTQPPTITFDGQTYLRVKMLDDDPAALFEFVDALARPPDLLVVYLRLRRHTFPEIASLARLATRYHARHLRAACALRLEAVCATRLLGTHDPAELEQLWARGRMWRPFPALGRILAQNDVVRCAAVAAFDIREEAPALVQACLAADLPRLTLLARLLVTCVGAFDAMGGAAIDSGDRLLCYAARSRLRGLLERQVLAPLFSAPRYGCLAPRGQCAFVREVVERELRGDGELRSILLGLERFRADGRVFAEPPEPPAKDSSSFRSFRGLSFRPPSFKSRRTVSGGGRIQGTADRLGLASGSSGERSSGGGKSYGGGRSSGARSLAGWRISGLGRPSRAASVDGRTMLGGHRSPSINGRYSPFVHDHRSPSVNRHGDPSIIRSRTPSLIGSRNPSIDGHHDPTIGVHSSPPAITLCSRCRERAERKLREGFDKFWEEVPRIFDTAAWQVLYKDDV